MEFRLHANSLDAGGRVLGWAKLCARLVDWCHSASNKEAEALPNSALKALCIIAPDLKDWILKRILDWRKVTSMSDSPVRRAQGLRKIARRIKVKNGTWTAEV